MKHLYYLLLGWLLLAAPARAQHLAAGNHHNLTLHADNSLWAWGLNGSGQVGIGTTARYPAVPTALGPGTTWRSVAAGAFFSAAIRADGTLWVWGLDPGDPLGLSVGSGQLTPRQLGPATTWVSVACGNFHLLALRQDGTLWSWGWNSEGQLGTGSPLATQATPVQVGTGTTWRSVGASHYASFAIRADGTLWAWGSNGRGELGLGSYNNQPTPAQVGTATTWSGVEGGEYHTLALRADGTLWAWGYNAYGQLGDGTTSTRNSPAQVGAATTWRSVSAGGNHSVALRQDGTLWSWGRNHLAQLGLNSLSNRLEPVQVGTATTWQEVAAGYYHTLAQRQDGTVWTWGGTGLGQLGTGAGLLLAPTLQAPAGTPWLSAAAGQDHSLGVRADGTLWAWGNNDYYQLGIDSPAPSQFVPTQVGTATTWRSAAAGEAHSLAVRTDGTLWAWGSNTQAQLGLGLAVSTQYRPAQVGTATTWLSVPAGPNHALAVRQDGTLWAWGYSSNDQLGLGTSPYPYQLTPAQVGTATTWQRVATSSSHSLAVRTDGTLWAWGNNAYGQLGLGTAGTGTDQPTPTQVGTATDWVAVAAGAYYSLAVRQDGTLWAWGYNENGQLGLGNTAAGIRQPTPVGTATDWAGVAAGGTHSAGWRQGGALYAWGSNYFGETGQGTTATPQLTPARVGTASWQRVAVSSFGHVLGLQTTNSLWGWGFNQFGQLAQLHYGALPAFVPGGGSPLATTPALAAASWALAPNPAHEAVQVLGLPAGPVQVRLYDATGRLVREASSATVPTAGLPPGLYLLRAAADGATRTLRLAVE